MGLIPVNSIPTPSFAWLATRPIAEKCDSESVIVSANLPPIGKGLSVLTKHPDRLSVRTRATVVRPDSRSVSSTAPPKWWRGARRGLANRTGSISGIGVSSKHAQPISSHSCVCEIFHTVLCRALPAFPMTATIALHRQHRSEPRLAVHHALISFRSFRQRIRLHHGFHFALRHEIQRFVEIFRAVLRASNYAQAFHEQIHERNRERFGVHAHGHDAAIRAQPLHAVHHGLG